MSRSLDAKSIAILIPGRQFGSVDSEATDNEFLRDVVELERSHVALDFSNVTFLTSLGLTMLLILDRKLRNAGRTLSLINLQPHIYDVFCVTHLNTILDVQRHAA